MSQPEHAGIIQADSLVTLHYRISQPDGAALISTFESTPATLQLGAGELAPPLERCLAGLAVGTRQVFELAPEDAFGNHRPELVETLSRAALALEDIEETTVIEFSSPDGNKFAGVVTRLDEASATVDFNHPLAGRSIRFEVEVIGVS